MCKGLHTFYTSLVGGVGDGLTILVAGNVPIVDGYAHHSGALLRGHDALHVLTDPFGRDRLAMLTDSFSSSLGKVGVHNLRLGRRIGTLAGLGELFVHLGENLDDFRVVDVLNGVSDGSGASDGVLLGHSKPSFCLAATLGVWAFPYPLLTFIIILPF